jgi:hypothetical protein
LSAVFVFVAASDEVSVNVRRVCEF